MRKLTAWLSVALCAAGLLTAIAGVAQQGPLIFLSTQLRPIGEAQKMRNLVLEGFPQDVDYITEQPQQLAGAHQGGATRAARIRSMSSARCTANCSRS